MFSVAEMPVRSAFPTELWSITLMVDADEMFVYIRGLTW
jgi:hypothetical protein